MMNENIMAAELSAFAAPESIMAAETSAPVAPENITAAELGRILKSRERAGNPFLVALEGRCASGKTTLARMLSERYGWSVIHADDFFLRPVQRTPERYAEPGGNLDRERLLSEVLQPLRDGKPVSYRPFDCHAMRLRETALFLKPSPVALIEGSYSCHPALWNYYDLRVFLTIDPATQLERIRARNGAEKAEIFKSRWIPMEERYFRAFSVARRCDYVIKPEGLTENQPLSPANLTENQIRTHYGKSNPGRLTGNQA